MLDKKFSRRNFIKTTALATFALMMPDFFSRNAEAAKTCTAKTRCGIYNGFIGKRGVQTWLGIPYAKPPVGKLRWHAPEMLEPSDKTFDAKKFGASPIQDRDPVEPASLLEQSEDCLTLNIFTRGAAKNLPVMVFIPGGGFVNGGSADPLYNGTNLAAHDVVVVTINYRLNIFGFMNFATIDPDFDDSGYLGMKDQIAALTWVKENIAAFGGDPDNLTVFGESAGAISIMLLTVTPAAHGLFGKAIAESGHLSFCNTPQASAEIADEFMGLSGCKKMSELMAKPAAELEQLYEKFCQENIFLSDVGFLPTCDGKFLPALPFKALQDGAGKGVKLLTGTTAEEYLYWSQYFSNIIKNMRNFHSRLNTVLYSDESWKLDDVYESWQQNHVDIIDEDERYFEFANQLDWRVGQELCAEFQSAFSDVYFYLFSQKASVNDLGSCHAIDLPFVFGNPDKHMEPKPSAKLVKQVQAAWVSFAATGNPNNDLIPQWTPYTVNDRETMEINSKAWTCRKDLNVDNLTQLRRLYEENLFG